MSKKGIPYAGLLLTEFLGQIPLPLDYIFFPEVIHRTIKVPTLSAMRPYADIVLATPTYGVESTQNHPAYNKKGGRDKDIFLAPNLAHGKGDAMVARQALFLEN